MVKSEEISEKKKFSPKSKSQAQSIFSNPETQAYRNGKNPSSFDDTRNFRSNLRNQGNETSKFNKKSIGGKQTHQSLGPIRDIDEDILRLVSYRTRLIKRLPQSSHSIDERELRTHWETQACKISGDPKLIRSLFSLLQEIDVHDGELDGNAFNLAPNSEPCQIDLKLPGNTRQAQILLLLATSSGQRARIDGIALGNTIFELIACLKQLGAMVTHGESDDLSYVECGDKKIAGFDLPLLDKMIHIGANKLNLYLAIFIIATRKSRVKLVGESDLRFLDLNPIRRFLSILGCRMTMLVPGQDGLPARIESSAILPRNVQVPYDLPDDAVTALIASSPFWNRSVRIDLAMHPHEKMILDEISLIFEQVGISFNRDGSEFIVNPSLPQFADSITVEMEPQLTYALLSIPAFTNGTCTLHGSWPHSSFGNENVLSFLKNFVDINFDSENGVCSSKAIDVENIKTINSDLKNLPPYAYPIALALLLSIYQKSKANHKKLDFSWLEDSINEPVEDFLSCLGYQKQGKSITEIPDDGEPQKSFLAPDSWWGIGYALASFVKKDVKLANPSIVTADSPLFWTALNSLPNSSLQRKIDLDDAEDSDEANRPRRFRSERFLTNEELPPEIKRDEDYY